MKLLGMLLVMVLGTGPALAITGPAGTKVTFGSNWIRFKQTKESFDRHNDYGKAGYARHGQIKGGCLVYGPYIELPHKGHVKAWLDLEVLVGQEEYKRRIHTIRGAMSIPQFGGDTPLFKVELAADSGRKILASRTVRFKHMRKWTGNATRWTRCTAGDPCTAGGPRKSKRTFYVYTDNDSSDIIGKKLRSAEDKVELRICDVNPKLTKIWIRSTTIELTY